MIGFLGRNESVQSLWSIFQKLRTSSRIYREGGGFQRDHKKYSSFSTNFRWESKRVDGTSFAKFYSDKVKVSEGIKIFVNSFIIYYPVSRSYYFETMELSCENDEMYWFLFCTTTHTNVCM